MYIYSNNNEQCIECEDGYYLTSNKTCLEAKDIFENCKIVEGIFCSE